MQTMLSHTSLIVTEVLLKPLMQIVEPWMEVAEVHKRDLLMMTVIMLVMVGTYVMILETPRILMEIQSIQEVVQKNNFLH